MAWRGCGHGFRILLTRSLNHIRAHDRNYLTGRTLVSAASIKVRSIKNSGAVWKEIIEGRRTAVKVETDLAQLLPAARGRAVAAKDLFVQFGSGGEVVLWECN